ncbi:MAG: hypothetical protein VX438_04070 [Planctomycetota bacterium]|nr:hypothetical protein [Planctomycetota bacterium]
MNPLFLPLIADGSNYSAVISFSVYILLVFALAILSNRLRQSKSFLSEYFLGSRTLGVWAFALTFAATSASGGSFMGFPSLVYTHGWILALWIAGYMIVPIVAIGLLAKRINQFSRKTNAITIPDMMRGRFESSLIGTTATYFIIFFMIFNLVAQFKAGSKILQTLLNGIPIFDSAVTTTASLVKAVGINADPAYVICLFVFGIVVIAYTTYGGFRAVVWTDVLQGFFMVAGVLFMLPLALWAVGGLDKATREMAKMVPPIERNLAVAGAKETIPKNAWLQGTLNETGSQHLFRVKESMPYPGEKQVYRLKVIEIKNLDDDFIASNLQLYENNRELAFSLPPDQPAQQTITQGKYVSVPGVKVTANSNEAFLPIALAISFFFFWTFSSAGQPSNMVRLMAFKDCATLKQSIFVVCVYYSLIYFPIVIIFCCARVLLPGWETDSDRIMPEMASFLTQMIEMPWLAGILVAAPFAAVMSTMDSFLLMISSAFVRDIYQRKYPRASESKIKKVTYLTTIIVGVAAMAAAINPPQFLQDLIIFTGGGLSTTFLAPIALSLYWKRMNWQGVLAGMITGFVCHCLAYSIGSWLTGSFQAYRLLGFDPFIPGSLFSLIACIWVSRVTKAPSREIVLKFFYQKKAKQS